MRQMRRKPTTIAMIAPTIWPVERDDVADFTELLVVSKERVRWGLRKYGAKRG